MMTQRNLIDPPDCDTSRDAWRTPPGLFGLVQSEFPLAVDVAADHENHLLPYYFTAKQNALERKWTSPYGDNGWWWCNPPFSMLPEFARKAATEAYDGRFGVMIVPANKTEQRWWHADVIRAAREVRSIRGRVEFIPPPGVTASTPGFACCLLIYSERPPCAETRLVGWP